MKPNEMSFGMVTLVLAGLLVSKLGSNLTRLDIALFVVCGFAALSIAGSFYWAYFGKAGRERRKNETFMREVPRSLLQPAAESIRMGREVELDVPVFLPDSLRSRHVHILGATGSGKTESVILNFLRQDIARGFGSIILDAKGDTSFLEALNLWVPNSKLRIFDLSSPDSLSYNPMSAGTALEAAQRLFSSLTWSEEFYKSRAFSTLQRLCQLHAERNGRNPTLLELDLYLESPKVYSAFVQNASYPENQAEREFSDLLGLRDQIKTLCTGHLSKILSPEKTAGMDLTQAANGQVFYFRLQSLLSPQLVTIVGRLLINHLSFLAGTAHRMEGAENRGKLVPVYLDEFATFASPEFADLISKARSAGYALHFSHQSIGDVAEVSQGFLSQITDNSATKIVLRINDPDSAEFLARSFGTRLFQKITQRVTNATELDQAEVVGEGTQREARRFRSPPDLFKTLPTGMASVLIAHGQDTPHGASTVFKIRFPKLEKKEEAV